MIILFFYNYYKMHCFHVQSRYLDVETMVTSAIFFFFSISISGEIRYFFLALKMTKHY